ncbi:MULTISPECIES: IucA/IucC family protein [Dickeya]|uniref:Achromobactin biosynthesis protein AcsD @ Siderophore synthetase superfamily, group A n=1 Tax=Dickeya aquatica TaxID=1401087 RepID=A0A375A956_9GAMM|nr:MULTISPECIES: IucA/IucC family protein [Dickeya]SLM62481.1 Achromobactin biosynthesis protein AcsD @ Siderophore synthetase superfamily, group A [Dickeya aquatica]
MNSRNHDVLSRMISEKATLHGLLNCFIKEFAIPNGNVRYRWPDEMNGIAPGAYFDGARWNGIPLLIDLPDRGQLFVMVDRKDSFGSQYYLSDVYLRQPLSEWHCLDFATLVARLLAACEQEMGSQNPELYQQIRQSQQLVSEIVHHNRAAEGSTQANDAPLQHYLQSEQGLWFGHPNHPAPKARLWPAHLGQQQWAPEFQASAALHQFEVPQDGLHIGANGLTPAQVLGGFADQQPASPGHAIICMHPVQAQLFMQDERVAQLLRDGHIRDLGQSGRVASPTASIRTWFIAGHDYFIKGSLNVRITNCVRKNAWYELESTVLIDRLFRQLHSHHADSLGGLVTVAEPGVVSWHPAGASEEDSHWFREQTGGILRENFCQRSGAQHSLMTGTLFARGIDLQPMIQTFLSTQYGAVLDDHALLHWFDLYQAQLLGPVLSLFFNHGVVMEPHLQNSVLVHHRGRPQQVLLRDFEGVKLTDDLGVRYLEDGVHPRVRQSLLYSREQGWNRIMYCLFINNLSEAILALSHQRPHLATPMWRKVRQQLSLIRNTLSAPAPELDALIAGGTVACKTNLKVRLAAQADRQAGYVRLTAPWAVMPNPAASPVSAGQRAQTGKGASTQAVHYG